MRDHYYVNGELIGIHGWAGLSNGPIPDPLMLLNPLNQSSKKPPSWLELGEVCQWSIWPVVYSDDTNNRGALSRSPNERPETEQICGVVERHDQPFGDVLVLKYNGRKHPAKTKAFASESSV